MQSGSVVDNDASTVLTEPFLGKSRKMALEGSAVAKKTSIAVAVILTLIGAGLSIAAVWLSSWQVVHLFEYQQIHEHGLWLDCTRHSKEEIHMLHRYETQTEPLNCVYKWDYDESLGTMGDEDDSSPVGEVNRHKFYAWHAITLVLLGLAVMTAAVSMCVGFSACRYRCMALALAALTLTTAFLSSVAEGVFFFYSHRADNRFINGIVGTYEQRVGDAFFLQLGACIAHFLAFLVAIVAAFSSFYRRRDEEERFSVSRASRSTGPNIQRTLEVDPPLLFQQTTGSAIIRSPPHYTKYQGSYKSPTASMPELPASRARTGSETCV